MIEAVENHMPEVIVIDEIGTELEAAAARTIAERGVQLVGTAHGNTLENLMMNPTLADLVGGIQSVTLGDEEARRRGTQKSILERKAPPTFDVVVEIQTFDRVAVHQNVAETVDAILRGFQVPAEVRELDAEGGVRRLSQTESRGGEGLLETFGAPAPMRPASLTRRIYPFGVSRKRLELAIRQTASSATVSDHLSDADVVVTLRAFYRRKPQALREAEARGLPIYVLRNNTISQMEQSLLALRGDQGKFDPVAAALQEAEKAISEIMAGDEEIELSPQNSYIRRLQHQLAQTVQSVVAQPRPRTAATSSHLPGGRADVFRGRVGCCRKWGRLQRQNAASSSLSRGARVWGRPRRPNCSFSDWSARVARSLSPASRAVPASARSCATSSFVPVWRRRRSLSRWIFSRRAPSLWLK